MSRVIAETSERAALAAADVQERHPVDFTRVVWLGVLGSKNRSMLRSFDEDKPRRY